MSESQVLLPVSNVTVALRRPSVSVAALVSQLKKKYPQPMPPVLEQKVLGKAERFVNYADPDYKAAVIAWEKDQNLKLMSWLTDLAVVAPDLSLLSAEIGALREIMPELTEGESDRTVWLNFYAMQGDEDFAALTKAVSELVGATEGQIAEQVETFRPNA